MFSLHLKSRGNYRSQGSLVSSSAMSMKTTVGITCKAMLHEHEESELRLERQNKNRVLLFISGGVTICASITLGAEKGGDQMSWEISNNCRDISSHAKGRLNGSERKMALFVSGIFMGKHAKIAFQQKAIDAIQAGQGLRAGSLLLAGWFFPTGECVMFLGATPGLARLVWHCASDQSVKLRLGTISQVSLGPLGFFQISRLIMLTSQG